MSEKFGISVKSVDGKFSRYNTSCIFEAAGYAQSASARADVKSVCIFNKNGEVEFYCVDGKIQENKIGVGIPA